MSFLSRTFVPLKKLSFEFWISFLLACVIAQTVELVFDRALETKSQPGLRESIFNFSGLYQRILSAPRQPVPRYTVLVHIEPNKHGVPSWHNVPKQRVFMAQLLDRIASASPDVIVVDKNFTRESENDPDTTRLLTTVQHAGQTIPIVVSRRINTTATDASEWLMPTLDFQGGNNTLLLFHGIYNLASDSRRVPLQWWNYENKPASPTPWKDPGWPYLSLPLRAAQAHDSNFVDDRPEIQEFVSGLEAPWIGFLKRDAFNKRDYSATDVLCGRKLSDQESWTACSDTKVQPRDISYLRSKIVVVGEVDPDDVHDSVVGSVQGYILQANYIEALLDDRYFSPAPCWVDYGLGFIFFFVFELILIIYEDNTWMMGSALVLLIVITVVALYFVLMHLRVYVNPVPVGLFAITIKGLEVLFARAKGYLSVPATISVAASRGGSAENGLLYRLL